MNPYIPPRFLTLVLLVLIAAVPACRKEPAVEVVPGLPQGELVIGEELTLDVQLALNLSDQAKGLMGVSQIPRDYGMVFLWSTPGIHSFYMKNTLIPLDIAFWDSGGRIIDIQTMEPCEQESCPVYTPPGQHTGAVEVRAGLFKAEGIEVGDRVELTEV